MHSYKILSHNNKVGFAFRMERMVKAGSFLLLLLLFASWARAQNVNIPDSNFKAALVGNTAINTNGDTEIQVSEATAYNGAIDVWAKAITDLTGIEVFVNLTELKCGSNTLTSLDLSKNSALKYLDSSYNPLTSLDVSNNTALTYLRHHGQYGKDGLTTLDLSKNTVLRQLDIYSHRLLTNLDLTKNVALDTLRLIKIGLVSLDLSTNTSLIKVDLYNNKDLSSLSISKATALKDLILSHSSLSQLDLSKNTALTKLHLNENTNLNSLNLSNNTALTFLHLSSCPLTQLDIGNTAVDTLSITNTEITNLDLGANTSLIQLVLSRNDKLNKLDISQATTLTDLQFQSKSLSQLDLSSNVGLTKLSMFDSNNLTSLNIRNNTALTALVFSNSPLAQLDLSQNRALESIFLSGNALTSLDLSANTALKSLTCRQNNFTSLDLSKNISLTNLDCRDSGLTDLDLSKNTALIYLNCDKNKLTNLDLSANTALKNITCNTNQLTHLDFSANTALKGLSCSGNQLVSLDVGGNTVLERLKCLGNRLTHLDLSANTKLSFLDCTDNQLVNLDLRSGNNDDLIFMKATQNLLTCITVDDASIVRNGNWKKDPAASYCNELPFAVGIVTPDAVNQPSFSAQIIFARAATGFDLSDLVATNAVLSNLQTTDNMTFTLDAAAQALGTITFSLDAGKVTDDSGNPNVAAIPVSLTYETTPPSASLSSRFINHSQREFTLLFSEKVKDFRLTDLVVSNGSVSSLTTTDNITYKFYLNNFTEGEISVSLPAGKITDLAGNPNTAATYSLIIDYTSPSVVISSSKETRTNLSPFPVTITFSEEIIVSREEARTSREKSTLLDVLEIENGIGAELQTTDNITFSLEVTPSIEGDVNIVLPESSVIDLAYNPNESSSQFSIVYDQTPPTCTISSSQGSKTVESSFPVTVTFSEKITGFELSDLSLVNGTASNLKSTDNKIFTFDLTPSSTGKVTIDVAANKVKDQAGNGNMVATQFSIMYDAILGLDDKQLNLRVYPNPVTNQLFIQTRPHHGVNPARFTLTDIRGKQVLTKEIKPDANGVITIDMKVYPIGLYFLNMMSEDGLIVRKVSKQ